MRWLAAGLVIVTVGFFCWTKREIYFARQNLGVPVPYMSTVISREDWPDIPLARSGGAVVEFGLPGVEAPRLLRSCDFGPDWRAAELPLNSPARSRLAEDQPVCVVSSIRDDVLMFVAVQGHKMIATWYW